MSLDRVSVNQILIRFDVRLHKDDYPPDFWNESHRDQFLLSPEIEWPLSCDPLVWPSVFFSKIFRNEVTGACGSIEVDPDVDDGNYWLNLEQMKTHYETHKLPGTKGVLVAFHLFTEKIPDDGVILYSVSNGIQCGIIVNPTTPKLCPEGSEFFGYDVADAAWISGLSNCGYSSDEKRVLRKQWGSRLNSLGLLDTLDDALEFRRLSDKRVAEHAPFWIYGITRLPYP